MNDSKQGCALRGTDLECSGRNGLGQLGHGIGWRENAGPVRWQ